jgi:hypothetical protein
MTGSDDECSARSCRILDRKRQRGPAAALAVDRLSADAPSVRDSVHDDLPGPFLASATSCSFACHECQRDVSALPSPSASRLGVTSAHVRAAAMRLEQWPAR